MTDNTKVNYNLLKENEELKKGVKDRIELIKDLFELHELLEEHGEISVGLGYSESQKILKDKVKKLT